MRLGTDTTERSQSPRVSNGSSNGLSPTFSKISNGHSNGKTESNGSPASIRGSNGVGAVRPYPSNWYGHDREEVARILIQSLTDLGYHHSARTLSKESGFELEGPEVAAFRNSVLQGEWAEAEALLFGHSADLGGGVSLHTSNGKSHDFRESWGANGNTGGLTLAEGANKDEMLFWLRQQKYLELLEKRDTGRALLVLRQELTPIGHDVARVHHLSSLLMCKTEDLKQQANWDGADGSSRNDLLSELSKSIAPSTMIPEHRLGVLLHETKQGWIQNCLYHNTAQSPSLYVDHHCDRSNFPSVCARVLDDHEDEVWFLTFSNNGKYLATAGKDKYVFIYDVARDLRKVHVLADHTAGVCHIAWSPDDTKIITCSREPDCMARIYNVSNGTCIAEISHFQHAVSGAAWAPDSNTFVVGSQDWHNSLSSYRLPSPDDQNEDCELLYTWSRDQKMRIYDVALSPDGRRLVALLGSSILVFDFCTHELIGDYQFDKAVQMTSVKVSADSKHMIVGLNENKIRLMVIDTGEILQTFEGHQQSKFMIRSVFGGAGETFIVSGSEDSHVYIWRTTGQLVESIDAHSPGCVNAVAWHPTEPGMFATAGDDKKVKIWTTHKYQASTGLNGFNR